MKMNKFLAGLLCGCLIAGSIPVNTYASVLSENNNEKTLSEDDSDIQEINEDESVIINETNFPDTAFRNYIEKNIDIDVDGVLSKEEINNTSEIDIINKYYAESISSLDGIQYFENLSFLRLRGQSITELDLSGCTKLTTLYCDNNQLSKLDVSDCANLTSVYCSENQIKDLDVSNCINLNLVYCSNNQLSDLDISDCTKLKVLNCDNNQLADLDVSNCTELSALMCYENQLADLDVSKCKGLTALACYSNQMNKLDVSENISLTNLICYSNKLIKLNLKNNANTFMSLVLPESADMTVYCDAGTWIEDYCKTNNIKYSTGESEEEASTEEKSTEESTEEETSSTEETTTEELSSTEEISTEESLSTEETSTEESSSIEESNTEESSSTEETSTEESSSIEESNTEETSSIEESSIEETSSIEESSTEETSSIEESSTEESSSIEESSTEETSSVEESSTEETSSVEESSTEESSSIEESSTEESSTEDESKEDETQVALTNIKNAEINCANTYLKVKKNNAVQEPKLNSVILNGKNLKKNKDYTVAYTFEGRGVEKLTVCGEYTMTITGKGKYTGSQSIIITVTQKTLLSKAKIKLNTGEPITGGVIKSVKLGNVSLEEGKDYTVSYKNNINSGKGTVILTAVDSGNYAGTVEKTFNIKGIKLNKAKVIGVVNLPYDVSGKTEQNLDNIVLKNNGQILVLNTDYTVSYENNQNAGTAKIVFTGIGKYNGTLKKSFKITPIKMTSVTLDSAPITVEYVKTGAKPDVNITYNGVKLIKDKDYKLTYKNNKKVTTDSKKALITIKGKGNYKGTLKKEFSIIATAE